MIDVTAAAWSRGLVARVALTRDAWRRWLAGRGARELAGVLDCLKAAAGRRGEADALHFWAPLAREPAPAWLCAQLCRPPGRPGPWVVVVHLPGESYPFGWEAC